MFLVVHFDPYPVEASFWLAAPSGRGLGGPPADADGGEVRQVRVRGAASSFLFGSIWLEGSPKEFFLEETGW